MKNVGKIMLVLGALMMFQGLAMATVRTLPKVMSEESGKCINCHQKKTPSIVQQWGSSKHHGANVGCYECHAAKKVTPMLSCIRNS